MSNIYHVQRIHAFNEFEIVGAKSCHEAAEKFIQSSSNISDYLMEKKRELGNSTSKARSICIHNARKNNGRRNGICVDTIHKQGRDEMPEYIIEDKNCFYHTIIEAPTYLEAAKKYAELICLSGGTININVIHNESYKSREVCIRAETRYYPTERKGNSLLVPKSMQERLQNRSRTIKFIQKHSGVSESTILGVANGTKTFVTPETYSRLVIYLDKYEVKR